MGAISKANVESLTDQIAAAMQKDLDGFASEYSGKTVTSMFDIVDAIGDPDTEVALSGAALAVDVMSFPENYYTALADITARRPKFRDFASALNTYVKSSPGGGYASFRAYLVDKLAKLHPLYGELHRAVIGEGEFTSGSTVLGVSNPDYAAIFPSRVYTGADGSLASDLADAISATTADVDLFASDNDCLYVGSPYKFQAICVALSTVSSDDITATIQYNNGSGWTTLSCTDNTTGFTRSDVITFTAPTDWAKCYKDGGGTAFPSANERLYYVRIQRTANSVVTPPVGTCITLIPVYTPSGASATTHLGTPQPPLALCRITGTNTIVVTAPAGIDYTRFAEPVSSESKLRARALTAIAQDVTITLAYVDAAGANGSKAESAWTAPAALGTKALVLTNTTDGLRSVRTTTSATTNATSGVFVIECPAIRTPAV